MKKAITAFLGSVTIAAALAAAAPAANAQNNAGAFIGGLAVGTMLGVGVARPYPQYAPAEGYVVYQGYGAAPPVGCPGGHWTRRPVAFNAYGQPVAWSRPRWVCPPY
jgi:hypothetical protein